MTVDFQDHFWGDKLSGFDALYQNLKCGSTSAKELVDFLRSRTVIEDYNFNLLLKLSRKTNNQQLGTFNPLWVTLKSSTEKLSSLHMQTLQRLNQLIKEINKYCDEHHKKQKHFKTEETPTIEAINELKETMTSLSKAKEFYYAKADELDKLKNEKASQKDIEKAEARLNKACGEYKNLIDRYNRCKEDFEKKFRGSCQNFQRLEEDHIKHMKDYLASYFQILDSGHALIGQVYKEFQNNCNELTTERLLEQFIKSKGTGQSRPVVIQFEEANSSSSSSFQHQDYPQHHSSVTSSGQSTAHKTLSNYTSSNNDLINLDSLPPVNVVSQQQQHQPTGLLPPTTTTTNTDYSSVMEPSYSISTLTSSTGNIRKEGFLRSKKDKSKSGKNKKDSGDDDSNNGSISSSKIDPEKTSAGSGANDFIIDSEGFTVRPSQATPKEVDNFYSSSGSDSDSDDEREKRIYVKINPLKNGTQISASVDQLIASAGALPMAPSSQSSRRANLSANPSPVLNDSNIKRSISATHTSFKSKDENDLFDIFNMRTNSSDTVQQSNKDVASNQVENSNENAKSTSTVHTFDSLSNVTQASKFANGTNITTNDRYAAFSDMFLLTSTSNDDSSSNASANKTPTNSSSNIWFGQITGATTSSDTAEQNVLRLPPKSTVESNTFGISTFQTSLSNSSLSKSLSSASIMSGSSFSVYKPLSKSLVSASQNVTYPNGMMSRADSISSLSSDFRMTPISLCSSRDSSPLTIGLSDTVPIAIAFQESIGACFKGADENQCKINVIGCIKIAFSSGIIQSFSSNPYLQPLTFRLKNLHRLERIIQSKDLITQVDFNENFNTYEMNLATLQSSLKRLYEQSPNARYYNLDIFKYQLASAPGAQNAPLHIVTYWKCEPNTTSLKIDFKYNSSAFLNGVAHPLKNIQFMTNVDSDVTLMTSQPEGKWDSSTKQAIWKYDLISHQTTNLGLGSIKAKFDLANGPSSPSSVYAQFGSSESTLSGLEFELVGSGYRLSLIKRQFSSGRYYCEPKL